MAADAVSAVPLADLVAEATAPGVSSDPLDRGLELEEVALGLIGIPALLGEVPDLREILLCGGCEPVALHARFAAMNASKSNGSGAPLASPRASAARSA